ncbi:TPA: hypothetical protein DIV48_02310 [Candidatus Kaiserbacteria bacterium]|nr:hypothetical protein [Candidatus Kaiserbacteria bacterium]
MNICRTQDYAGSATYRTLSIVRLIFVFPRRKRLPRSAFPAALSTGRRISSAHFSAILPKEAEGYAVVVSKKIARLSVVRHRIKRRVLEALRGILRSRRDIPPALILFPKQTVERMDHKTMQEELEVLISRTSTRRHAGDK